MVITFHGLMLRSEKNNAEQNALAGLQRKINTTKVHCKIIKTDFRNKAKISYSRF